MLFLVEKKITLNNFTTTTTTNNNKNIKKNRVKCSLKAFASEHFKNNKQYPYVQLCKVACFMNESELLLAVVVVETAVVVLLFYKINYNREMERK